MSGTAFLGNLSNLISELGLSALSTQSPASVAITGGAINGTSIGLTAPSSASFTTINAFGTIQAAQLTSTNNITASGTVTSNAFSGVSLLLSGAVTFAYGSVGPYVAAGFYTDSANSAVRATTAGGSVYLQNLSGATTYAIFGPSSSISTPLTVSSATTFSASATFASDPIVNSGVLSPQMKALFTTTGGGTITFSAGAAFSWSARIICMNAGTSTLFSTAGYFDVLMPPNGTVVTGYNGIGNQTTSGSGISIGAWQTLYYILPIGQGNTSLSGNFAIAGYGGSFNVPAHWLPIATRNGDTNNLLSVLGGRYLLQAGDSLDTTTFRTGIYTAQSYGVGGSIIVGSQALVGASVVVGGATGTVLTSNQLYVQGSATLYIGNAGSGAVNISNASAATSVLGNLSVAGLISATGGINIPGVGTNGLYPGNGDGASYTVYDMRMAIWWGLGMTTYDGTCHGYYNARSGIWDTQGGYNVNGTSVIDSSRSITSAGITASGSITSTGNITAANVLQVAGGSVTINSNQMYTASGALYLQYSNTTGGVNICTNGGGTAIGGSLAVSGTITASSPNNYITAQSPRQFITHAGDGGASAFIGTTFQALWFGYTNTTGTALTGLAANAFSNYFAISQSGKIGSVTNGGWANAFPIYRNVLDDGTGNATISGSLNVGGILYGPGNMTQLYPGNASVAGYIGFHTNDVVRRGYIGYGQGSNLVLNAETGWGWCINGASVAIGPPLSVGSSITIGPNGNSGSGSIYSDANWGMYLVGLTNAAIGHFSFRRYDGYELARIDTAGTLSVYQGSLNIQNILQVTGNQIYTNNNGTLFLNQNSTGQVTLSGGGGPTVIYGSGLTVGTPMDSSSRYTMYDSGGRNFWAGIVTEVGAQLIDYGINYSQLAGANGGYQGGALRVDARAGQPLFQFLNSRGGATAATLDNSGNMQLQASLYAVGSIFPSNTVAGNFRLYNDGNAHVESATPLWLQYASANDLHLCQGGGNTYHGTNNSYINSNGTYFCQATGAQFCAPGYMLYSDGGSVYFLLTGANGAGQASISFNGYRPFYISLANGSVGMQQGLNVSGGLNVDNITVSGSLKSPGIAKAWVIFNNQGTISGSFGVSSVTVTSGGYYTINFPSGTFPDTNYAYASAVMTDARGVVYVLERDPGFAKTATAIQFTTVYSNSGYSGTSGTPNEMSIVFYHT